MKHPLRWRLIIEQRTMPCFPPILSSFSSNLSCEGLFGHYLGIELCRRAESLSFLARQLLRAQGSKGSGGSPPWSISPSFRLDPTILICRIPNCPNSFRIGQHMVYWHDGKSGYVSKHWYTLGLYELSQREHTVTYLKGMVTQFCWCQVLTHSRC